MLPLVRPMALPRRHSRDASSRPKETILQDCSISSTFFGGTFSKWAGKDLNFVEGHLREKFAVIFAVGLLAKQFGVLPADLNITAAVRWAWEEGVLKKRQTQQQSPADTARQYIKAHQDEFMRTPVSAEITAAEAATCPGFVHKNPDGSLEYLIPPDVFRREFGSAGGPQLIIPVLAAQGLAKIDNACSRKYQLKRQLRPGLRVRMYCLSSAILELLPV